MTRLSARSGNGGSGLFIIGGSAGIDPDRIAAADPVWEEDITRFGPWDVAENSDLLQGLPSMWRAAGYAGPLTVFIAGRCPSTMDLARDLIRLGRLDHWGSVLAVEQTAGRGQKQRAWISPPGNIYGSWFLPPIDTLPKQPSVSWRPLASLLAGAVMASGLGEKGVSVRIKWPNDLIIEDRKVCGLLVEDRDGSLVVGTGINIVSAPDDRHLREDFVLSATRLRDFLPDATPLDLWLHLIESGRKRIEALVESLIPEEFVGILEERMAWIGRKVLVRRGEEDPFEAVFSGLAGDGGLRIRRGSRTEILYTGSLLPIE